MPQRDSLGYTVTVALVLCIVCSLGVSAAAVILKDRQEENKRLDRQRNIIDATGLAMAELGRPASELSKEQIDELYKAIEEKLVDLETGQYTTEMDMASYDPRAAAKSGKAELVTKITDTDYPIGVDQRERIARVYLVHDLKDSSVIKQVVLPVYGKGLWSTLYGYLALKRDLQTVQGLTFYEHAETPGLGGEVDNPMWKAQWEGVWVYGEEGTPVLGTAKGVAPAGDKYLVDGLSGATITSRGVTNMVRYWTSDQGYGPFLERLRTELEGTAAPERDSRDSADPPQQDPEGNAVPALEPEALPELEVPPSTPDSSARVEKDE